MRYDNVEISSLSICMKCIGKLREVLVSSAENFCKVGSGSCITECLNEETGKIRNQKSWISFAFRAKHQQITPLPVIPLRVEEL